MALPYFIVSYIKELSQDYFFFSSAYSLPWKWLAGVTGESYK